MTEQTKYMAENKILLKVSNFLGESFNDPDYCQDAFNYLGTVHEIAERALTQKSCNDCQFMQDTDTDFYGDNYYCSSHSIVLHKDILINDLGCNDWKKKEL